MTHNKTTHVGHFSCLFQSLPVSETISIKSNKEDDYESHLVNNRWLVFPLNLLPTSEVFFFFLLCMTDSVIVNGNNMLDQMDFPL